MKVPWKIIGVFTIFIVVVLVLFAYNIVFNKKPSITLIPDGYIGPVVIWYSGKGSVSPKYENGNRVYAVPLSGILKESTLNSGGAALYDLDDDKFFYVKEDGSRSRLPLVISWYGKFRDSMNDEERNKISVYGITSGRINSENEYFVSFVVGKVSEYESLIKQRDAAIGN